MRYIKLAIAIVFFELMIGKLGYEYGYASGGSVSGIGWWYAYAIYAMLYIFICVYQGWSEASFGKNIFSAAYITVPYAVLVILALLNGIVERESSFSIAIYVLLGIALVLEIGTLILQIKEKVTGKNYQSK